MELKEIISYFENPKRQSDGSYMVRCPCHKDDKQSLHISQKGNKILMRDHGFCKTSDILEHVGLKESDLFIGDQIRKSYKWHDRMEYGFKQKYGEGAHIVSVYNYRDHTGKYLFSKIRLEGGTIHGKEFVQARIDYEGDSYEYGLGKIEPTLYNLPELLRSIADGFPVYYVEGEKDVETLRGFHYTATTSGSASGWKKEYSHYFTGATVIIIPDNDKPGEKLALEVMKDLKQYAFEVVIVPKLSGLEHGDVTDYFEKEKHTLEEFKEKVHSCEGVLAPWAYVTERGTVNIKPPTLAVNFSKVSEYIIVRNPLDDNDLFYGFENGVYRRCNKAQIKSALRRFVPVTYQKDNQIAEAQRTIFELGERIHSWDDLDSNERYINFRNGLYDVEQKKLIPHDPKILSTMQLQFDYDPTAKSMPVFQRFMDDLFTKEDGTIDHESMMILQEFSGLAISNIYVYRAKKALFLCSLRGNTGKSVFMNLIQYIIGEDNVTSVPIQHMNENIGRFTMGTALGKRMIINGDQTESDIGDSSYFKQLTGGDRTKMENKNQKPLMVRYRGGIMVGCNGLPSFTDDKGEHIFERLLLIMCTNVIPEDKRDSMLLDKMKPEAPAIINWFLEGLHRLIENNYKFKQSKETEKAIHEYRKQLDSVYRFICEYEVEVSNGEPLRFVITKNRKDKLLKKDIYEMYENFCNMPEVDLLPVKKKNFGQRLERLGLEIDPRGNYGDKRGVYVIYGLALTNGGKGGIETHTDPELVKQLIQESKEREGISELADQEPFDT